MDERILKSLYDVKLAIEEIESFLVKEPKTFNYYQNNLLLKRGIERNLEIIGEAVNRILKENSDYPLNNAKRIVGLRNQIIHAYDGVSDEYIWSIVINNLPKLKIEVEEKIKENN